MRSAFSTQHGDAILTMIRLDGPHHSYNAIL